MQKRNGAVLTIITVCVDEPILEGICNNLSEQNSNNFLSFQQTQNRYTCISVKISKNGHIFIAHAIWFIGKIMLYDL